MGVEDAGEILKRFFVAAPELIARHLSPDGELNNSTVRDINYVRGLVALTAGGLLVLALHKRWASYLSLRTVAANAGIGPWALAAAGIGLVLTGAGLFVSAATGTPVGFLLRDPNAIAMQPFYYGALEYAGAILLAATAGIGIFSSTLSSGSSARFLISGGLLSLLLACDDLYSLHENSWRIGLNERIVFGVYGLLVLIFAVTNARQLLASLFVLFIAAGALFALGIAMDKFVGLSSHFPRRSEDILELIGICFWSAYFIKCSRDGLRATQSA